MIIADWVDLVVPLLACETSLLIHSIQLANAFWIHIPDVLRYNVFIKVCEGIPSAIILSGKFLTIA